MPRHENRSWLPWDWRDHGGDGDGRKLWEATSVTAKIGVGDLGLGMPRRYMRSDNSGWPLYIILNSGCRGEKRRSEATTVGN